VRRLAARFCGRGEATVTFHHLVRLGYKAWIDYRFERYGYDPLFAYYRWAHRAEPQWVNNLRSIYTGRFRGMVARPPLDLRQQLESARRAPGNERRNILGLTSLTTAVCKTT